MKVDKEKQDYLDNSLEAECATRQYKAEFGGYRAHFVGWNTNFKKNTPMTFVACTLLTIPAYILTVGVLALGIWWGTAYAESYKFFCLAVLIATVFFFIIVSYVGTLDRRNKEREYIKQKEVDIQKVNGILKKEQEEADALLNRYTTRAQN